MSTGVVLKTTECLSGQQSSRTHHRTQQHMQEMSPSSGSTSRARNQWGFPGSEGLLKERKPQSLPLLKKNPFSKAQKAAGGKSDPQLTQRHRVPDGDEVHDGENEDSHRPDLKM